MEYSKFGNTGLDVSRLCLGTMGFGNASTGMFPWAIDEEKSEQVIKQALDLGINFFDTANIYSHGDSERPGQALEAGELAESSWHRLLHAESAQRGWTLAQGYLFAD